MTSTETHEQALEQLVGRLDLDAAVRLLTGQDQFELYGDDTIGLRPMVFSDGPTGVRGLEFIGGRIVALLPNATLVSGAWDEGSATRVGELLAEEAHAQGVQVVLGPTINLHRTPLGGRLFEAYSEDPLLSGRLAAAYVRGLQAKGVGGCLKHYVGNESETDRHTVSSAIGERALRELYLLPFQIAIEDAHPWTIMAAYNDVNGVAATEHTELIQGVLRGEWAWDGLLMSDWYATKRTVEPANAGLDLVMPGPEGPWGERLIEAVRRGEVAETTIREHVLRLLRLAQRVGALGPEPAAGASAEVPAPDGPTRVNELRALAIRGMTVLKNERQVLPLDAGAFTAETPLVVAGHHALRTIGQGAGSAHVRPPHVVPLAAALSERLGDRAVLVDGVDVFVRPPIAEVARVAQVRDPDTGRPGIRVTSYREDGEELASTFSDVAQIAIGAGGGPHDGGISVELVADLELTGPTAMQIGVRGAGEFELEAGGHHFDFAIAPTEETGELDLMQPPAWTTVVDLQPGGRITVRARRDPNHSQVIGVIARPAPRPADEALAAAREAAQGAPIAVVVVGLTEEQETESFDKSTLALPGRQDDLVRAVAGAAKRTVVVVNAATPVLMPWLDQVDAVLWAGLPGQEAGTAIASAVFGATEPSGRLVTTFPRQDGDGPAWSVTPADGRLDYEEGVAGGYRGWFESDQQPLFWFGAGLGYGRWRYHSAELGEEQRSLEVALTNESAHASREVVQVYLQPEDDVTRLIGWAAAIVAPGSRASICVTFDERAMRAWEIEAKAWGPVLSGKLLVARGLGDIRLQVPFPNQD